jgi:hypothetical protein
MKKGIMVLAIALATTVAAFAAQNVSSAEQLAALKVYGNGTPIVLDQRFSPGRLNYSAVVEYSVEDILVNAAAADASAHVAGNGLVKLVIGNNDIPVTVIAADGTSAVYTLTITRAPNEPLTDRSDN